MVTAVRYKELVLEKLAQLGEAYLELDCSEQDLEQMNLALAELVNVAELPLDNSCK